MTWRLLCCSVPIRSKIQKAVTMAICSLHCIGVHSQFFINALYVVKLASQKDFNSCTLVSVALFLSELFPTDNLISVASTTAQPVQFTHIQLSYLLFDMNSTQPRCMNSIQAIFELQSLWPLVLLTCPCARACWEGRKSDHITYARQKDTLEREAHGPNPSTFYLYQAFITVPTPGMTRDSGCGSAGIGI
jgi:hypothetical protein